MWFDEKNDSKTTCVIPYDSIPYVFLGKKVLMCSLGPDKHKTVKKRLKEKYHQAINVSVVVVLFHGVAWFSLG